METGSLKLLLDCLLQALKFAPRYLVSLAIGCAFLLFSSESLLKNLGIYDLTQHYRAVIAIVFIFTSVLFVVDRSIAIFGWIRFRMEVSKISKARLKRLHSLTEDEKQILRFYIFQKTRTSVLRIDDGVVQGLESAGIIYQSSNIGNYLKAFAYNVTEFSWEYINQHQEILTGTTKKIRGNEGV